LREECPCPIDWVTMEGVSDKQSGSVSDPCPINRAVRGSVSDPCPISRVVRGPVSDPCPINRAVRGFVSNKWGDGGSRVR
jgi:hypothetical protein